MWLSGREKITFGNWSHVPISCKQWTIILLPYNNLILIDILLSSLQNWDVNQDMDGKMM